MLRKVMAIGVAVVVALALSTGADAAGKRAGPKVPRLKVSSDQIKRHTMFADEQVGNLLGCSGGNVSLEVKWSGEPAGTKSFAITMYDPDAPTGSGFWHWVVFNIPATVHELPKGAGDGKGAGLPPGAVQVHNDASTIGYFGPCPPPGDKPHRYYLTVFAVDADHLDGNSNTSPAVIGFQLHYHTLAKGTVTGHYARSK